MSLGREALDLTKSRLATARFNCESAEEDGSAANGRHAGIFRLAGFWQVPVGYEDATGFHCGEPQVPEVFLDTEMDDPSQRTYRF
jgi:hypothetical protein